MLRLHRYRDVAAALRDPRLVPAGTPADATDAASALPAATRDLLSPRWLAALRGELEHGAREQMRVLRTGVTVDLLHEVAAPWSLCLAARLCGVSAGFAAGLITPARRLFLAAAFSTDGTVDAAAQDSAAALARSLQGARAGGALAVQAFVALSQTLPCALAATWLALFQHPNEFQHLRVHRAPLPGALDELLRLAGPARAVFRRARAAGEFGGVQIQTGDPVVLALAEANRDPAVFPGPDRLEMTREPGRTLSFGLGEHYCAGASLVRTAMAIATNALLDQVSSVQVNDDVEWIDGFAIHGPATLPVTLTS